MERDIEKLNMKNRKVEEEEEKVETNNNEQNSNHWFDPLIKISNE